VGTQAVQCGAVVCGLRSCVAWLERVKQSGILRVCVVCVAQGYKAGWWLFTSCIWWRWFSVAGCVRGRSRVALVGGVCVICGNGLSWLFNGLRVCGSGQVCKGCKEVGTEWHFGVFVVL